MNKALTYTLLALLITGVFGLRMWYSLATPGLSSDESYWHLRNAENIIKTGLPLFDDPLAWGGRTEVFSPLFDYLLAFLGLLMPIMLAAKLLSAILAAALVPAVFGLCSRVSKSSEAGLLCATLSALTPALIQATLNQVTPLSLLVLLLCITLYALLRIREERWLSVYVTVLAIASFTHPTSAVITAGLAILLVLAITHSRRPDRPLLELTLFSTFFFIWSQFLVYKKILFLHGVGITSEILQAPAPASAFPTLIGTIPLLVATYITWKSIFNTDKSEVFVPIGFGLATALMALTGLTDALTGASFLSIPILALFANGCAQFRNWLNTTRLSRSTLATLTLLTIGTIAVSAWPASIAATHAHDAFPPDEQTAMEWLKTHTEPNTRIGALAEEGQRIMYISQRSTFIDTHTLGRLDSDQRTQDLRRILTATTQLEALDILNQYGIEYIYISSRVTSFTGLPLPNYLTNECFSLSYDAGPKIYKKSLACQVKTHY